LRRPLTECVYPHTRPLAHERIEALVAFAAPGEFEPVTFALYPVRSLRNLKVRVMSLTSSSGEIPARCVDVRLATFAVQPRYLAEGMWPSEEFEGRRWWLPRKRGRSPSRGLGPIRAYGTWASPIFIPFG